MPYKDPEVIKEYHKNYYNKNKKEILKDKDLYYKTNKEKIRIRNKKYYQKNKEEIIRKTSEYRKINKDKVKRYDKIRYQKNKDVKGLQNKVYYQTNKEKINKKRLIYQANRRRNDPSYKLICNIRRRTVGALKGNFKSNTTMIQLGIPDIEFLWKHLEGTFKPGMTRENYGLWHVDHIIPCSSFDLSNTEEQARCFHYSNLQALWAHENLSKGSKV